MAALGTLARAALSFVPGGNLINKAVPKGTGAQIAKTVASAGAKAKLPELGVSELFGKAYGNTQTYAPSPAAPAPAPSGGNGGLPWNTTGGSSSGTSGGSSTSSSSGQMQDLSGYMQQAPEAPGIDFDALIAPALQALDDAVGPLQQESAANIQGIQQGGASKVANAKVDFAGQQATLDRTGQEQVGVGESAVNEQRRQFSEIQQGLQARYGGTTGTGAFATEIAGSQALKNVGQIRQQVSTALQAIGEKRAQVQEIGRIALQDIEDNTSNQISKEKANLEQALSQIRIQKGELQMRKAELAANAIQVYQNTVNQINAQNTAFKQNLFLQQQAAEQQLQLAQQKGQQLASSVGVKNVRQTLNNPVSNTQGSVNVGTSLNQGAVIKGTTKDPLDELINQYAG